MEIHFSVDDTIRCFRWLSRNKEKCFSIFNSYVFEYAKQLHDLFQINVTFYCMYCNDIDFALKDMSDKWKNEFILNSEWLKFGFHTYDGKINYKNVDSSVFSKHFNSVNSEINRFAGKECITDILRLHYFEANSEIVKFLISKEVTCLLCADDQRISYDLNENISLETKKHSMIYRPTDIRIEKMSNVEEMIAKYRNQNRVIIFTHEIYLDDINIRKNIIALLKGLLS